ncbi:unnamed protein product [Heligmosomoides polygyrus]|uniref:TFIIIC_sub6 domain-containing protein n=1 Tax=Heligmosomoides polygyrus TaxID=6339 RepID=A0A183FQV5_HELPZ|nr:unnamed protein product [Heligmosomoides polygyrus]
MSSQQHFQEYHENQDRFRGDLAKAQVDREPVSVSELVLCVLLVCGSITANRSDATHCSDVTDNVNYTIVGEVKAEVPGLVYDDSYFPLAQRYGINRKKPDPENDCIYLDKEGSIRLHYGNTYEHLADATCSDVTEDVNAIIVGEVQIEVPTLDSTAATREERKIAARLANILREDAATFVEMKTDEDLDAGDSTDNDTDWDYNDDEDGSTTSGNEVYFGTSAISPDEV